MEVLSPYKEATEVIVEAGGEPLRLCYQCGTCTGVCPWNLVRSFIVRRIIHEAQLGATDFESEEIWSCVSCRACVQRCPRGVEIIDIMRAIRRAVVSLGVGTIPDALRISMKNVSGTGNPMGEEQEKRADWAKDLGVKAFTEGTELLYFPCCYPVYEPREKGIALATINILNKAGVDFGILGTKEACCGEIIRKSGDEATFQSLAESNIRVFAENGVKRILVSSPHCYNTFRNEYPDFGGNFEVIHSSQYLLKLIKEHRVEFTKELNKRVVYSDPCYLGRHNDIYDEPREVLKSIPGLELIEMPDYREEAICCGGGGGGIWEETKKGQRFSDLRLEQAIELGAEVLAIACPICMCMFKDSQLTVDKGETIEIKDISELVYEAM